MNKSRQSLFAVALLCSSMLLAACGQTGNSSAPASVTPTTSSETPATTSTPTTSSATPVVNKFRSYTGDQFLAETWTNKTVSYQFFSETPNDDTKSYGMAFYACADLYSDGSIYLDVRNYLSCKSTIYYGAWDATKDSDGYTLLKIATLFVKKSDTETVAHKYTYDCPISSTNTFTWTDCKFLLVVGQSYSRNITMTGSATAKYASWDAYHTAVDKISVSVEFDGAMGTSTIKMVGLSNGVAKAFLYSQYNGSTVKAHTWDGGIYTPGIDNSGAATGYSFDFTSVTEVAKKFESTVTSGAASDIAFTASFVNPMTSATVDVTATLSKAGTISIDKDGAAVSSSSSSSSTSSSGSN